MTNTNPKFRTGVSFLFKGWRYLLSHRRLWIPALLPTLINLALFALMLGVFFQYYGDFYAWLTGFIGGLDIQEPITWYWKAADALLWVVDKFFQLLVMVLSLLLMLIIFYAAGFVISAPFNDALSERVETMLTGREPIPFSWSKLAGNLLRTLRAELLKTAFFLGIPLLLMLLAFLPLIGAPLSTGMMMLFSMFDLGFNYVDYPMSRRLLPFSDRLRFGRHHARAMIGFGLPVLIPFANFFLMAPLVVGGTMLYVELSSAKELHS